MLIKITLFFICFHLLPGYAIYQNTNWGNFQKIIFSSVTGVFISLFFFQLIKITHLPFNWIYSIPVIAVFIILFLKKNNSSSGHNKNIWPTLSILLASITLFYFFGQKIISFDAESITIISKANDSIFTLLCSLSWTFGDKILYKGYHYYDSLLFHVFNEFTGLSLIHTLNLYFILLNIITPVILFLILKKITSNYFVIALALTLFMFDIGLFHVFIEKNIKYGNTGFLSHLHNIPILFARILILIIIERLLFFTKNKNWVSIVSTALLISISLKIKINLFIMAFGVLAIYTTIRYFNNKNIKNEIFILALTIILSSVNIYLLIVDHISKTAHLSPLFFGYSDNKIVTITLVLLSLLSYWILLMKKPNPQNELELSIGIMACLGVLVGYLFIELERPHHGNFFWFRIISFYLFSILYAFYYSSFNRWKKFISSLIILTTCYLGFGEYKNYSIDRSDTITKSEFISKIYFHDTLTPRRHYLNTLDTKKVEHLLFQNK